MTIEIRRPNGESWKIRPRIALMSVGMLTVLAVASSFFMAPEEAQKVREPDGHRADPVVRTFMQPETAAPPVANKVAPWVGLCPAYAATTVEGFKAQVMNDPQLMDQYRHFDWNKALIFENQEDSLSSVLYKKNGQVYWTRKMLRIKKGERILTDGKVLVRTYCCNQIALAPPGPFLPPDIEPPPEEIQPPEAPAIPEFPFALAPPILDLPPNLTAFIPAPAPVPLLFPKPRSSPRAASPRATRISEPGAILLLLSGLVALTLLRRSRV